MAHLLGRQDCVESLRRDVIDLQAAVLDVFSRTGPVRVPSWKFPDKVSCNVDLVQLLQEYDYTEGETEFNQHSHIVLLELLIDRLMLLLQSFNVYTELTMGAQKAGRSGQTGPPVSIGPVVKRYWSNLVQLSSQQRRGKSASESSQRSLSASQRSISQTDTTSSTSRTALSAPSSKSHHAPRASSTTPGRTAPPATPSESRSVSVQTVESALVPCAACARVQSSLKESAEACLSLCRTLGVDSFLQHLLVAVEDTEQLGRLTASDLAQWACEQRRDMGRIEQHVTEVKETVDSLRNRLKKAEEQREKLKAQLEREKERAEREREERRNREEEWERRLQELRTRGEEVQRSLQGEQEELKRGAKALELRISELSGELELQRETQQSLRKQAMSTAVLQILAFLSETLPECERDSLVEEVHCLHLREEERRREEQESRRELEMELSNTHTLLDKESAKYRSAQRQHEAMQVKQCALLERVGALVQQCEDLQTRLEECEDERTELTHTLTHTTQERDTLQEQLAQQQSQCQSLSEERERHCAQVAKLEDSVFRLKEDLQQAAQRERILVAFPELNTQHTAPQSTGDVLGDMEQQLKANSVRIRVLEQENASLSNGLARLRETAQSRGDRPGCPDSGGPAGCKAETAAGRLGSWDHPTSPQSSSLSPVHQQTLCLSLSPNAAETYTKIRQTVRSRSACVPRRRK